MAHSVCRKCDELEAKLEQLGALAQQDVRTDGLKTEIVEALTVNTMEEKPVLVRLSVLIFETSHLTHVEQAVSTPTAHDVLWWAEEVG